MTALSTMSVLSGRIVLITGASSGLGAHFAQAAARAGAAVVIAARRADRLAELKARIEASGGRALAVEMDVADEALIHASCRFARGEEHAAQVDVWKTRRRSSPTPPRITRRHSRHSARSARRLSKESNVSIISAGFAGKIALVTGGAAGIGRATALGLAERGAKVLVSDIAVEHGEAVAAEIRAAGGEAAFQRADVTDPTEVHDLIARTIAFGGRIDIAHNNVGFSWGQGVEQISEDEWDKTVDLCLKAPWLCLKHELPAMVAQGGGVIVNTASMAGVRYAETANIAYSAAKAGVIHMTRYAAAAYAKHNIRVNAVSPGLVKTRAVEAFLTPEQQTELAAGSQPIGRIIEPREIADAVIWLCSDASAMVTGENMCVAGGQQAL